MSYALIKIYIPLSQVDFAIESGTKNRQIYTLRECENTTTLGYIQNSLI